MKKIVIDEKFNGLTHRVSIKVLKDSSFQAHCNFQLENPTSLIEFQNEMYEFIIFSLYNTYTNEKSWPVSEYFNFLRTSQEHAEQFLQYIDQSLKELNFDLNYSDEVINAVKYSIQQNRN